MIRNLANRCLILLSGRIRMDLSKQEVYLYGLELFLHTLFSTIGLLAISILFHRFFEGCIMIALYYINQTLGGGFHASTHMRCFITMSVGLVIALLVLNFQPGSIGIVAIAVIASGLLLAFPLKLHRNKAYLAPKSAEFRKNSRIVVCLELLVFIVLACLGMDRVLFAYSLGMAISAVSRLAAIVLKDKERGRTT